MTPEAQLDTFLAKFDPSIEGLAKACLRRLRQLVPGATQTVYDAYNALSVGFGASEHLRDGFLHLAVYPRRVNLGFNRGTTLDDPKGLLCGTGTNVRHVRIRDAGHLEDPDLTALVHEAVRLSGFVATGPDRMVIKRIYARQRSRKPKQE